MNETNRPNKNPRGFFSCPRCQALVINSARRKHLRSCGHDHHIIECHVCHEQVLWGQLRKHSKSHHRPHAAPYKKSIKFVLSAEALAKARAVAIAEEGSATWKTCRDVVNRIILKYEPEGKN